MDTVILAETRVRALSPRRSAHEICDKKLECVCLSRIEASRSAFVYGNRDPSRRLKPVPLPERTYRLWRRKLGRFGRCGPALENVLDRAGLRKWKCASAQAVATIRRL